MYTFPFNTCLVVIGLTPKNMELNVSPYTYALIKKCTCMHGGVRVHILGNMLRA